MALRAGNNPKRRIAPAEATTLEARSILADALVYSGNPQHKRKGGNYGFHPPASPRPSKSLCDGVRPILKEEAISLFRAGILKGLLSAYSVGEKPKYVWGVDGDGEPYEAKIGLAGEYHGYRLEKDDDMREIVLREWNAR